MGIVQVQWLLGCVQYVGRKDFIFQSAELGLKKGHIAVTCAVLPVWGLGCREPVLGIRWSPFGIWWETVAVIQELIQELTTLVSWPLRRGPPEFTFMVTGEFAFAGLFGTSIVPETNCNGERSLSHCSLCSLSSRIELPFLPGLSETQFLRSIFLCWDYKYTLNTPPQRLRGPTLAGLSLVLLASRVARDCSIL